TSSPSSQARQLWPNTRQRDASSMHILLPPSETKRAGGGSRFAYEQLSHHAVLGETRKLVRGALVALSTDVERAAKALKLGVKSRGELAHNVQLERAPVMPAIERYSGVLYDALGVHALSTDARAWLESHVSVQSA